MRSVTGIHFPDISFDNGVWYMTSEVEDLPGGRIMGSGPTIDAASREFQKDWEKAMDYTGVVPPTTLED